MSMRVTALLQNMKTGKVDLGWTEEWLMDMTADICSTLRHQTFGPKDTAIIITGYSVTFVKDLVDSTILQNLLLFNLKFTSVIV